MLAKINSCCFVLVLALAILNVRAQSIGGAGSYPVSPMPRRPMPGEVRVRINENNPTSLPANLPTNEAANEPLREAQSNQGRAQIAIQTTPQNFVRNNPKDALRLFRSGYVITDQRTFDRLLKVAQNSAALQAQGAPDELRFRAIQDHLGSFGWGMRSKTQEELSNEDTLMNEPLVKPLSAPEVSKLQSSLGRQGIRVVPVSQAAMETSKVMAAVNRDTLFGNSGTVSTLQVGNFLKSLGPSTLVSRLQNWKDALILGGGSAVAIGGMIKLRQLNKEDMQRELMAERAACTLALSPLVGVSLMPPPQNALP